MTAPNPEYFTDSNLTKVAVPNPAAGVDWIYTFTYPAEIVTVFGILTTSATVANRTPVIIVDDGGNSLSWLRWSAIALTASNVWLCTAAQGLGNASTINTVNSVSIPQKLRVQTGWRLRTLTNAIDVGDQWSNIQLTLAQ